MKAKLHRTVVWVSLCIWSVVAAQATGQEFRRLPVREYRDKMKAGWIGQIFGVSWGAPTEGRYQKIMPAEKMPPFREELINDAFGQDDLYVEMTFLRTMEEYGYDVSIRQAGIDFANSGYPLWCANNAGRKNLRAGIAPPDSASPPLPTGLAAPMTVSGAMAAAWPASVISVPAEPAHARRGATYTTTGTALTPMSETISCIVPMYPPGVLSWMMTRSAPRCSAVFSPR